MKMKIGILGLGTIGSEVVNTIMNNAAKNEVLYGVKLEIKKIFVRDVNKKRAINVTNLPITSNIEEIIDDDEIITVIECIGGNGTYKTYEYIKRAILGGKNVIISSKKVLGLFGQELITLANERNVILKFDATVGGGIPIAKVMENCFHGGKIQKIMGIANATSNFICSRMYSRNYSFSKALEEAKDLGYAENNSQEDIDGYDALYKAVILSIFGFGKYFNPRKLSPKSISSVERKDIEYSSEFGYIIKPIFSIADKGSELEYYIGPGLVKKQDVLSKIDNNNNIIIIDNSLTGLLAFSGQGAGKKPTASAIYDDIWNLIKCASKLGGKKRKIEEFTVLKEKKDRFYIRLSVPDSVGSISLVSNVFSNKKINIDKLVAKDKVNDKYEAVLFISKSEGIEFDEEMILELERIGSEVEMILTIFD